MTPTELGNAFSTMTLSHLDDAWYMDVDTTSHMTHNLGNLLPLYTLSTKNHILVGSANRILISGYGYTSCPDME